MGHGRCNADTRRRGPHNPAGILADVRRQLLHHELGYDGPLGAVYVGAAAHCTTGVGQAVYLASGSLGTAVEKIGTVAYSGKAGSTGAGADSTTDYCLIRLSSSVLSQVRAAMAGYPGIPKGVSTLATAKRGDKIQFSGHGVGFDATTQTQQGRVGVLNWLDQGQQYVLGAVTPGDSGGPIADVTDGNKALGIVDDVGVAAFISPAGGANVGEFGMALYFLLQDANAHGFKIHLRTV